MTMLAIEHEPVDERWARIADHAPILAATARGYIDQISVTARPGTITSADVALRLFASWIIDHDPSVVSLRQVNRRHIEHYKLWLATRENQHGQPLKKSTINLRLSTLRVILERPTLMDMMIRAEDHHLERYGLGKGIMHLLEEEQAHSILDSHTTEKIVPAGATTNTLLGISALGGKCILVGQVGKGPYGDQYEEIITREGITSRLVRCRTSRTGKVINLVTPDAERTMGVHLGAAINLQKDAIFEEDIRSSRWFYFTGYELESIPEAVNHAIQVAKGSGVKIAMDVADPALIARNRDLLNQVIHDHVDLLFMNEIESRVFTGLPLKMAAKSVDVGMVVVKNGAKGSIVRRGSELHEIKAQVVHPIDTTGAGDLYAAGFLYGLIKGYSLERSGRIGSVMGSMIVSQIGAFMGPDMKSHMRRCVQDI